MIVAAVTGILASKYLRTLTIVAVVTQTMREEPLLIAIVVFVVEIHLKLLHAGLQQVEVPALGVGACCADELQLGILSAESSIELFQALRKHSTIATVLLIIVPLLITYTEIFQVEGRWMAHICTNFTPFRVYRTIGKFHQIEGILDIAVEIVESHVNARFRGIWVLELTTQSAADHRQGLAAEILTELEELEKTKAIALVIIGEETMAEGVVPAVLVERTVLYGAYAVLPLIAALEVGTLNDTAAGEAEYARVHVEECLSKILTHAVLAAFPRVGGEEGDVLDIGSGLVAHEEDAEGTLGLSDR